MTRPVIFIGFIMTVMFAGCASQSYQVRPIDVVKGFEQYEAKTLGNSPLDPNQRWGLKTLSQTALDLNPQLEVAKAQWRAAKSSEITMGQKPNPSFSTNAEHHSQHTGISPWSLGLVLDIPIETHGKREARIAQSQALSAAAELEIAETAWHIRSQVRKSLLEVYANRQKSIYLEQTVQLRKKINHLLENRFQAGLINSSEMAEGHLQLQKAESMYESELKLHSEALNSLAFAIGVTVKALHQVELSFDAFPQDSVTLPSAEIQREALLNRLNIRKALARYDAAEARLKLEIAKQHPDFSLSPGYNWDQGDNRWSLGWTMLLAWINKNEGPIAEANAARELEAKQFEALQASVIDELSGALIKLQNTQEMLKKKRSLVELQQIQKSRVFHQFDAGYADQLDTLYAELELLNTSSEVSIAEIQRQQDIGALEDALQKPLDVISEISGESAK